MRRTQQKEKASGPTELLPHLILAGATDVRNAKLMASLNVHAIINVARELDTQPAAESGIKYLKVTLDEMELISGAHSYESLNQIYSLIEEAKALNKRAVIHCLHGRSRSAFVVLCYLMYDQKMNFKAAFEYVKTRRPSILVPAQRTLQQYDQHLTKQRAPQQ